MRIQLAAAVALAPLMMASGAAAQTVISNVRTTPITTSTANNGNPGSITIGNGGTIRVSTGTAVTLDSSHDVTNENGGVIEMRGATNNTTGILVVGGNSGDVTNSGTILVTETYTPTDSDGDGDLDGVFAQGTGRYGIRVVGPGALTGDISSSGPITVVGNQSAGISVETDLIGHLQNVGGIIVTGSDSYGVRTTGTVTGDIFMGGNVDVSGENSVGFGIEGDVNGHVTIGGIISSSGFRYTSAVTGVDVDDLEPDDLLIGGAALSISGNVTGGVLVDLSRIDIAGDDDDDNDGIDDDEDPDADGDGIIDQQERDSVITSFGSAPGVQIGSMTNTVTLGVFGTGAQAYGFMNYGSILGSGVYDGIEATGLRIGLDGGMAVTIDGGVFNSGGIESISYNANGSAFVVDAGATVPTIRSIGGIQAFGNGDAAFDATAIDIRAGATVSSIDNDGNILAVIRGEDGNAYGIRDASGSLSSITNTGSIRAVIIPTDDDDDTDDSNTDASDEVVTGRAVAIDLSANTSGVTLIQDGIDDGDDLGDGQPDSDADGDGVDDLDEPSINGDIILGSGADNVEFLNGEVNGDIEFGAGADTLLVDGGTHITGSITDADGLLDINIVDGTLTAGQTGATTISGLSLGADSDLLVTVDGANQTAGGFIVNGTANITSGAGLGARFTSLLVDPTRFVIIQATTITAGDLDQSRLQANSPYMYVVSAGVDSTLNQIYIDARHRTSAEFGFIASETAAYGAFYEALSSDQELLEAFLGQTGRDDFFNLYEQMLPDHSGGSLISLATGVDAVTRALSGRGHPAGAGETSAWLQEINFYADKDRGQAYGFRSEGFGFAGGIERGSDLGAFGLSVALTSSDLEDPESEAEEVLSAQLLELGLYWRAQGVHWNVWTRAAVGFASFDSVRQLVAPGINRRNESDWNGYSLALAAGAAYDYQTGRWSIRPEAFVEYFRLNEDAHDENGGGAGFDLAYEDREGHILSSTVAVSIGAGFGENRWLRPEIRLGYRQIISHDPGSTVASFISTGTPFTLNGDSMEGGGPIVGLRLNLGNELGFLSIEADAEMLDDYLRYALLLRASFRF